MISTIDVLRAWGLTAEPTRYVRADCGTRLFTVRCPRGCCSADLIPARGLPSGGFGRLKRVWLCASVPVLDWATVGRVQFDGLTLLALKLEPSEQRDFKPSERRPWVACDEAELDPRRADAALRNALLYAVAVAPEGAPIAIPRLALPEPDSSYVEAFLRLFVAGHVTSDVWASLARPSKRDAWRLS